MIMAVIVLLASTVVQLIFTAIGVSNSFGLSSLNNAGPHGFSEIMYAFVSMAGNNGSAFAGLNANTLFYNLAGSFAMLVGRFAVIIPALAIAGTLVEKKPVPQSARFPTATPLFVVMLVSVVIVVGALSFFPPLSLGPLLEQLLLQGGKTF
jgi:K+-transporting ATPase ATPase A chain